MNSTENGVAKDVAVPTPEPDPTPFGTVPEPAAPAGKEPFVPKSGKKDVLIPKNLGGLLPHTDYILTDDLPVIITSASPCRSRIRRGVGAICSGKDSARRDSHSNRFTAEWPANAKIRRSRTIAGNGQLSSSYRYWRGPPTGTRKEPGATGGCSTNSEAASHAIGGFKSRERSSL